MDKNNNTQNESRLPLSRRSLVLMLAAVVLLALGFVLLSGGGLKDPQVFNYDMFNFRRLTPVSYTHLTLPTILLV